MPTGVLSAPGDRNADIQVKYRPFAIKPRPQSQAKFMGLSLPVNSSCESERIIEDEGGLLRGLEFEEQKRTGRLELDQGMSYRK